MNRGWNVSSYAGSESSTGLRIKIGIAQGAAHFLSWTILKSTYFCWSFLGVFLTPVIFFLWSATPKAWSTGTSSWLISLQHQLGQSTWPILEVLCGSWRPSQRYGRFVDQFVDRDCSSLHRSFLRGHCSSFFCWLRAAQIRMNRSQFADSSMAM